MPEDRALIHFRCIAAKHQEGKPTTSDTLTIHEGKWAYCPFDVRAKGHEWEATAGLSVNEVRMLASRGNRPKTEG